MNPQFEAFAICKHCQHRPVGAVNETQRWQQHELMHFIIKFSFNHCTCSAFVCMLKQGHILVNPPTMCSVLCNERIKEIVM